jgi:hypothetical protein
VSGFSPPGRRKRSPKQAVGGAVAFATSAEDKWDIVAVVIVWLSSGWVWYVWWGGGTVGRWDGGTVGRWQGVESYMLGHRRSSLYMSGYLPPNDHFPIVTEQKLSALL